MPISLADALFTKTQQRLLALLFGQPSRSFFTTELIELTGSGAVQRELKRLTSSGLVNVTLIGKRKHYKADPVSPVFDELRGLGLKTVAMARGMRGSRRHRLRVGRRRHGTQAPAVIGRIDRTLATMIRISV